MAKQPTITDVSSGFLSSNAQNLNNSNIRQAFDNTLSRDGSTPNTMEADLDMNSNDILNISNLSSSSLTLNGIPITPDTTVGTGATPSQDGLMTKEDKAKLDGLGGNATITEDGLMASEDKVKLDNLRERPSVDDSTELQAALDAIAALPTSRGDLSLDMNTEYSLTSTLTIDESGTRIDGLSAKWEGAAAGNMVRIVDSERAQVSNFFLSGDDTNVPTAAIWLDAPDSGTSNNANITLEKGSIGRALTTDTASGELVQNGILVSGVFNGNNDEFIVRDVNIHDATVAGINIENNQSIWGRVEGGLLNTCEIGLLTGANVTMTHPTFNRNVTADVDAFREIQVWVTGSQAENSEIFGVSRQGASLYFRNGKMSRNDATAGQFFDVRNGGNLVLENLTLKNTGGSGDTIKYRQGSSSEPFWVLNVSNCTIDDGSLRSTWDVHTALTGSPEVRIKIAHDEFVWETCRPYIDILGDFGSTTDDTSSRVDLTAASTLGNCYNVALSVVHNGHVTDAPDSTTVHRSRWWNVTGGTVDLAECNVRIADLSELIDFSTVANLNPGTLANGTGATESVTLPGVHLGDFVSCGPSAAYIGSQFCAYVQADDTVEVRVHNATGGTNIPAATDFTVAKLDSSKFRFKGSVSYAGSTVADDATLEIPVTVKGAQVGAHAFFSYGADLQDLFVTAEVTAADTVTVRLTNKTGAGVTLAASLMRAAVLF